MSPRTKKTRKNAEGSKKGVRVGCEPNDIIPSGIAANPAHTPAQRIDKHSRHTVMRSPPSQHSPNHQPPTDWPQPLQQRAPPASWPHYPPSYYAAAVEEMISATYADDYPAVYPEFPEVKVVYPSYLAAAIDYHSAPPPVPQPVYLQQATDYPSVDVLPQIGRYPLMQQPTPRQPPLHQHLVQTQPTLQLPIYSIGHRYPPPLQSLYQSQQWASAASSLLTADQQLLYYSALPRPVDSTYPGLFELPTKQNNESEATAGSALPLHTPSLAETTRKFDEILGKRADQRTEEEKKFREEHLAARELMHEKDATDRKRRRLRS